MRLVELLIFWEELSHPLGGAALERQPPIDPCAKKPLVAPREDLDTANAQPTIFESLGTLTLPGPRTVRFSYFVMKCA